MSVSLYRAWRFIHPAADTPPEHATHEAGMRLTPTGGIEMVHGDASVRQAIRLLLSTSPGERVMRPEYGCDLHRLVFSPNDDTTAGLAIHYVRQALERWERRIQIVHLDAGRGFVSQDREQDELTSVPVGMDDPAILSIVLEYRVRATQRTETLYHSMNLSGEGT